MFKHQFYSRYIQWFDKLIQQVKNDTGRDQQDNI